MGGHDGWWVVLFSKFGGWADAVPDKEGFSIFSFFSNESGEGERTLHTDMQTPAHTRCWRTASTPSCGVLKSI
jgi:hypothetical protein